MIQRWHTTILQSDYPKYWLRPNPITTNHQSTSDVPASCLACPSVDGAAVSRTVVACSCNRRVCRVSDVWCRRYDTRAGAWCPVWWQTPLQHSPDSRISQNEAATALFTNKQLWIKLGRILCTHYFMSIHNLRCSVQLIEIAKQKSLKKHNCDPSARNQSHVGRVRFPLRAEMHRRGHITDSCFIAFITSKIC